MTHPMLRFHDGYDGTSPALHDEVIAMQTLLTGCGFPVESDGFFGPGTVSAVTARAPKPPIRTTPHPPDGGGFGRGLMQIDYDSHPFARNGQWADPGANLMYGAGVLSQNSAFLARSVSLGGVTLLHAALSAYNCGAGNVQTAVRRGLDLDFFTSGRDYGRDALNRAGWFWAKGWQT